jgi:hypothetical protein
VELVVVAEADRSDSAGLEKRLDWNPRLLECKEEADPMDVSRVKPPVRIALDDPEIRQLLNAVASDSEPERKIVGGEMRRMLGRGADRIGWGHDGILPWTSGRPTGLGADQLSAST